MRTSWGLGRGRWVLVAGLAVGVSLMLAGPAEAKVLVEDEVVLRGSIIVAEGETVGAAVIFDGPAVVRGTVDESLVVFHGDVDIYGTVRKDVVVFSGDVVVHAGAVVGGDLISTATPTIEEGGTVAGDTKRVSANFDFGAIGVASRVAWWIGYSGSTLFLGLILLVLAPALDGAISRAARDRTGAAIGIGVGWFFLLPLAAVLLMVTVVGIPLGLFVLLALALLYTVGYVAGSLAIGRMVVKAPASRYLAFLAGWVIVRLVALIPVVAGIAWTLVAIAGFGALAVAARRKPAAVPVEAPPPPPMPA